MDDEALQEKPDEQGEPPDAAATATGQDHNVTPHKAFKPRCDDSDDDDPKRAEFELKQRLIEEKYSIAKEAEAIEAASLQLKRDLADREYQARLDQLNQERKARLEAEDIARDEHQAAAAP